MTDRALGYRVLLVDDDERQLRAYRTLLKPQSFSSLSHLEALVEKQASRNDEYAFFDSLKLDEALQGLEAVVMVERAVADGQPYSLAFLDMRMPPGIDGLETAKRIRAIDPRIYLVFVTAYSDIKVSQISTEITDNVLFLHKPFHADEIQQVARNFILAWQKDREIDGLNQDLKEMLLEHLSNALVYDIFNPSLLFLADKVNAQHGLLGLFKDSVLNESPLGEYSSSSFLDLLIAESDSQSEVISLLRTLFVDELEKTVCNLTHVVSEIELLLPELSCLPSQVYYRVEYLSEQVDSFPFYKRHLMVLGIHVLRCLLKRAIEFQVEGVHDDTVEVLFSIGLVDQGVLMRFEEKRERDHSIHLQGCISEALIQLIKLIHGQYQIDSDRGVIEIFCPQKEMVGSIL